MRNRHFPYRYTIGYRSVSLRHHTISLPKKAGCIRRQCVTGISHIATPLGTARYRSVIPFHAQSNAEKSRLLSQAGFLFVYRNESDDAQEESRLPAEYVTNRQRRLAAYQASIWLKSSMYRPAGTFQLKSVSIPRFCRARKASGLLLYRARQRFRAPMKSSAL